MLKSLSLSISSDELRAFAEIIQRALTETEPVDMEDKLLLAVLQKLHKRFWRKSYEHKPKNTLKLDADEAFAIAILYDRADIDAATHIGNSLHKISNDIQKQFI